MRVLNKTEVKAISGASNDGFWTGVGHFIGRTAGTVIKYMPKEGYVAFN